MRIFGVAIACCLSLLTASLMWPGVALSMSLPKQSIVAVDAAVQKVHGFHCKPYVGWNPVAGAYQRHSHPGICNDYQRCLREHERCIFVNGRGFEKWQFERWGSDNWRYSSCMIRSGCY